MSLFIFRFWPVLIPLLVYYVWHLHTGRKAVRAGAAAPRFRDGPWYWAVLASLLVGLACFLLLGMEIEGVPGTYEPAHMENGVLVPGRVTP